MASMKVCQKCKRRYRRSKNRHDGLSFCSERCRWESRDVPIELIFERDDGVCHLCDGNVPRHEASRDHLRPKSLGGRLTFENIKLAHVRCNSVRGSLPVREFRAMLDRRKDAARQSTMAAT